MADANILDLFMKWKALLLFLAIFAIAIYLNRAYAHIYTFVSEGRVPLFFGPAIYNFAPPVNPNESEVVYVALGDSLTAGVGASKPEEAYPYLLAEFAAQKTNTRVKLVNLAIPGATAYDVVKTQLSAMSRPAPNVITILIGANDLHQKVSPNAFKQNLTAILSAASNTRAKIYLFTIPFLGDSELMLPPYRTYFDRETNRFNRLIAEVARNYPITVIDLYSLTRESAFNDPNYYSQDGFHPSAVAYSAWAKSLYDFIDF